jgi:hypothetical protein
VAISLQDVLSEINDPSDDLPPPLPPLPEDDLPAMPLEDEEYVAAAPKASRKIPAIVASAVALLLIFGIYQWMSDQEKFEIRRYPKMSLEIHQKILGGQNFEGFDKKIFFREYASPDLTYIWLVTTGYQRCDVEAVFRSVKDRLLTMSDEEVELVTRGKLSNHVAEFNVFEFRKGMRIIPGLYEMDIRAQRCEWDGIIPRIRNLFTSPEKEYEATTRVVLYPRGPEEFQEVLSQLMKKKEEMKKQTDSQEQLFWDDLQMKFQTIHAMALQIEQHLLDFLDKGDRDFNSRLKVMIAQYTKKYGQALTEFVVANEGYFDGLSETDLRSLVKTKDYEGMVRTASKSVGMESMKVIEKLQTMKKPKPAEIKALRSQVLKNFEQLKISLTKLLLEMTADRSKHTTICFFSILQRSTRCSLARLPRLSWHFSSL